MSRLLRPLLTLLLSLLAGALSAQHYTITGKMVDGSVLEIKLTNPDGNSSTSNIKLTPEDLKILKEFFK